MFHRGSMSSAVDMTTVVKVLFTSTSWFADIKFHGSPPVPTYFIVYGIGAGSYNPVILYGNTSGTTTKVNIGVGNFPDIMTLSSPSLMPKRRTVKSEVR